MRQRQTQRFKKTIPALLLLLSAMFAGAQLKQRDSLYAIREFARLGEIYTRLPLRMSIHIRSGANPVTTAADTIQADVELYYGKKDFYMETEGMEEIMNDSLVVMVNNQAKKIMLYPNNGQLMKNIEKTISLFRPDSSVEALGKLFTSRVEIAGHNSNRVSLKSRQIVYGTAFPKESVSVIYRPSSYEPVEFIQTRVRLLPVDSLVYHEMEKDPAYKGKFVSVTNSRGNFYFLVKELTLSYQFKKINYNTGTPPVTAYERISKDANGSYLPAKGFEEYMLSTEF
jgi:hypothetical protein